MQFVPAQAHLQVQPTVPSSASAQRPFGPQSTVQPSVVSATIWPLKTYSDIPWIVLVPKVVLYVDRTAQSTLMDSESVLPCTWHTEPGYEADSKPEWERN